jgi:hypothetical protein
MSVIGNEFSGLPIADLIGGPLKAACDAQVRLAKATADFITSVGFNPELDQAKGTPTGKLVPRQVDFSFWRPIPLTKPEVLATGTVTFVGGDNSAAVTSIKVGAVEVLAVNGASAVQGGATASDTAATVAAQINRLSSTPKYTASSNGAVVTIAASAGTGASPNGTAITVGVTAGGGNPALTGAATPMAGGSDAGGETQVQKVVLSVPFLSVVNVPALMVKNVDIVFDMEVKSSESHKDDTSMEASLDATAKVGWGPFSAEVKIHGAVSAHQENTRSTDRSAKYHVQVQARDDGMPEGLSRVLDILQKAIAPVSVSKAVDLKTANVAQKHASV